MTDYFLNASKFDWTERLIRESWGKWLQRKSLFMGNKFSSLFVCTQSNERRVDGRRSVSSVQEKAAKNMKMDNVPDAVTKGHIESCVRKTVNFWWTKLRWLIIQNSLGLYIFFTECIPVNEVWFSYRKAHHQLTVSSVSTLSVQSAHCQFSQLTVTSG